MSSKHSLQIKLLRVFLVVVLLVVGIVFVSALSLQRVTETSTRITEGEIPRLRSIRESIMAITLAQSAMESALSIDQFSKIFQMNQYESTLRKSIITFDMYMAAVTWGSESEAFAKSELGINAAEWQRAGFQDVFKVKPASPEEAKVISQAALQFAGFRNNSIKAIASRKKFLRLQDEDEVKSAALALNETKEYAAKARKFTQDTELLLEEAIQLSNKQIEKVTDEIEKVRQEANQTMIAIGLVGVFLTLLFSFFTTRKMIVHPLKSLLRITYQFGVGNLSERAQIKSSDEIGQLGQAFNQMASQLQQSYQSLEQKVKEKTKELSSKVEEIEKKNKNMADTETAMLNILEDSKEYQELLTTEKQNVEGKVIERTKELTEEHARFTASIQGLSIGFLMTDIKDQVILSNPALTRILRLSKNFSFAEVVKNFDGAFDIAKYCKMSRDEKKIIEVKSLAFANNFLRLFIGPILLPEAVNDSIGTVILVSDITEEKILERSRDEFFSIASHELRTPLTAIRGNTSLIQSIYADKLTDKDLKEMIEDIHESSTRLIHIVNDFLDTSRLELGKMQFKYESFDLNEIIDQVVKEYMATGSIKNLSLHYEPPKEKIPEVYADRDRVKQALINLVGNGFKFTDKGGVTITCEVGNKDFIKVFVKDTGRGIPPEGQKLLFRKFQQAGGSIFTRDALHGTGLGLYISKMIIEAMGGKIELEQTEIGKGSTFSVTIPITTEERLKKAHLAETEQVAPAEQNKPQA